MSGLNGGWRRGGRGVAGNAGAGAGELDGGGGLDGGAKTGAAAMRTAARGAPGRRRCIRRIGGGAGRESRRTTGAMPPKWTRE